MNRLINVLYETILFIISLLALPKLLYDYFIYKKYRQSFFARLGIKNQTKNKKIETNALIWIHAVSMGETKAAVALTRELKRLFPDSSLLISSTTETGHAEAKRSFPFADFHIYLPFDFASIIYPLVSRFQPRLVILSESDLWYNFLRYSKDQGAVIALVSGKMSERSMSRFKKVPFFTKRLLNLFDVLCLQNNLYKERFDEIEATPEKVVVTGNLKLDEEYPQLSTDEVNEWKQKLGIDPTQLVLTIGSTHDPEEQLFIQTLKEIWKVTPNLKVLIVPRHPERFKEVAQMLQKADISSISFTNIHERTGNEKVILIDAMGMLRMCYQLSDMAIVGGSYTKKVGGHNILEPCWYGKPVLFGPCMHTQVELVDLVKQYQAGLQVGPEELKDVLLLWIENAETRKLIGRQGISLIQDLKGSTKRTVDALSPFLINLKTHREMLVEAK